MKGEDREAGEFRQLVARIPRSLHQAIRLHCIESNISVMAFVGEALEERLGKPKRTTNRPAPRKAARAARVESETIKEEGASA